MAEIPPTAHSALEDARRAPETDASQKIAGGGANRPKRQVTASAASRFSRFFSICRTQRIETS